MFTQSQIQETVAGYLVNLFAAPEEDRDHKLITRVYVLSITAAHFAPTDSLVRYHLALSSVLMGKHEDATVHYREALELDPNDADIHADYALHLLRTDETDLAENHVNQAIRLKPEDGRYLYARGLVNSRLGENKKALDDFVNAEKILCSPHNENERTYLRWTQGSLRKRGDPRFSSRGFKHG
jgi:Flp pilus assembly protein TadD